MLFDAIDKTTPGLKSEEVLRDAMESGATKPEDFAKAFQNAGLKPEAAEAAGRAVEAHFRLVRTDEGIAKENREALETGRKDRRPKPQSKLVSPRALEWFLIACSVLSLLVVPWRFTRPGGHLQTAPYALLFWQHPAYKYGWFAEIDTTRYLVQVFAVAAACGIVYLKLLRDRRGR
jgi:hypothetical protein